MGNNSPILGANSSALDTSLLARITRPRLRRQDPQEAPRWRRWRPSFTIRQSCQIRRIRAFWFYTRRSRRAPAEGASPDDLLRSTLPGLIREGLRRSPHFPGLLYFKLVSTRRAAPAREVSRSFDNPAPGQRASAAREPSFPPFLLVQAGFVPSSRTFPAHWEAYFLGTH